MDKNIDMEKILHKVAKTNIAGHDDALGKMISKEEQEEELSDLELDLVAPAGSSQQGKFAKLLDELKKK